MDIRTRPRRPATRPPAAARRRPPRFSLLLFAGGVLAAFVAWGGLRVARDGVLPNVAVADVTVGGLHEAGLRAALAALEERREQLTIVTRRAGDEVAATAAQLGYDLDIDATAAAVLAVGRQSNPLASVRDQLWATFTTIRVAPVDALAEEDVQRWLDRVDARLGTSPFAGSLEVDGTRVRAVGARPGQTIDRAALAAGAREAVRAGRDAVLEVTLRPVAVSASQEQLDAIARQAEAALAGGPVELVRGDVALLLEPTDLATTLDIGLGDDETALELTVDPEALGRLVSDEQRAALESTPQDAAFTVEAGTVRLVPARTGFRFDAAIAAEQVAELLVRGGARSVALRGDEVEPEFTTADAEALAITERVSSFTTEHACCQGRVRNIQRIADLVRGVVIAPGETFSLNRHVGPRTQANGFVPGGAISAGEFVDQIGGGVSQFTTTMFNAIFFGGYRIDDYKPHSYYISRYPEGREATLNFDPPVDLVFTNNSPFGIYVDTSYTDTSITVSFYGTEWVEVDALKGERHNFRSPREEFKENPALAPGTQRVVSSGRQGFDVDVTRVLEFPDGRVEREVFSTVYLAEPRVIEVGPGSPTPTASPASPATADPSGPSPTAAPSPAPAPSPSPSPAPAPSIPPPPEPASSTRAS